MALSQRTHLGVHPELVGAAVTLDEGRASATLVASAVMAADDRGLVHGGFTFGLADYAAMLAVNDPNVVLGAADCRFLAPVRVGERMTATAEISAAKGRKRTIRVAVAVAERVVLEGELTTFVLDQHVLDA